LYFYLHPSNFAIAMRALSVLLAFISSAFAYQVLVPNASQGWTNQGGQSLSWDRVSTDSLNFTVVLDNQNITGFSPQVLAALVDGSLGNATMNPPSGGWPTGTHFRVNLVRDTNSLSTMYAQSVEFSILPPNGTSTTSKTVPATALYSTTITDSSPTDTALLAPTGSSGALASYSTNTGMIALLSLLAYALA